MARKYKIIELTNEVRVEDILKMNLSFKDLFNIKFLKIEHITQHYEEILLRLYKDNAELKGRVKVLEKRLGIDI